MATNSSKKTWRHCSATLWKSDLVWFPCLDRVRNRTDQSWTGDKCRKFVDWRWEMLLFFSPFSWLFYTLYVYYFVNNSFVRVAVKFPHRARSRLAVRWVFSTDTKTNYQIMCGNYKVEVLSKRSTLWELWTEKVTNGCSRTIYKFNNLHTIQCCNYITIIMLFANFCFQADNIVCVFLYMCCVIFKDKVCIFKSGFLGCWGSCMYISQMVYWSIFKIFFQVC